LANFLNHFGLRLFENSVVIVPTPHDWKIAKNQLIENEKKTKDTSSDLQNCLSMPNVRNPQR